MHIKERGWTTHLLGTGLLLTGLIVSACGTSQISAPTGTKVPTREATETNLPLPSETPTPTLTPIPLPVNADMVQGSTTISTKNATLIEHLTDLWPPAQTVASAVFYDETHIALATGDLATDSDRGMQSLLLTSGSKVVLWDLVTNSAREVLSGSSTNYSNVATSPDKRWIAFVNADRFMLGELKGISFQTTEIDISEIGESYLAGVAFSHDSRLLAIVGDSGGVMIWDVQANRKVDAIPVVMDKFTGMSTCPFGREPGTTFSADDKSLLFACDGSIRILDLATGKIANPKITAFAFALSPRGDRLAIALGSIKILGYPGKQVQVKAGDQTAFIKDLVYSPDGSLLAASTEDGKVTLWDAQKGTLLTSLDTPADMLGFSPDGKFLFVGTTEGGGALWGVRSTSQQATRSGVRVVLSENQAPIGLTSWEDAIPKEWLAPQGTFPRYEIRLVSGGQITGTACQYTTDFGIGDLNWEQLFVNAQVFDLTENKVVGEKVFDGSIPPNEQCPNTWSFSLDKLHDYIDGTAPELAEFEAWLKPTMGKLGYK